MSKKFIAFITIACTVIFLNITLPSEVGEIVKTLESLAEKIYGTIKAVIEIVKELISITEKIRSIIHENQTLSHYIGNNTT